MKKHKTLKSVLKKLNFTSVFFFLLSLVSTTFAWFAYSNIVNGNIELELKAWDIAITEDNSESSRSIEVSIDSFYPGIEVYTKELEITNNGDLDAIIDYEIKKLRILDTEYDVTNQEQVLKELSQNYPFFFNFITDTNFLSPTQMGIFKLSIGWPLDSGDDEADSMWGIAAMEFSEHENSEKQKNDLYKKRAPIELNVEVNIRQYVDNDLNASDNKYRVGNEVIVGSTTGYVIDKNNLKTDSSYNALVISNTSNTFNTIKNAINTHNYSIDGFIQSQNGQPLPSVSEFIAALSSDIYDSEVLIEGQSSRVIGNGNYEQIVNKLIENAGSVIFNKLKFNFLDKSPCIWTSTEIDNTKAYAIKYNAELDKLTITSQDKNTACRYATIINQLKTN